MVAALCAVGLILTLSAAPSTGLAISPAPERGPADAGPLPEPVPQPGSGGARQPPCRSTACRKRVEQFCKKVGGCGKFSEDFRDTKRGSKFARGVLTKAKDLAFRKPYNGTGFEAHHTVPQGRPFGGVSDFAQTILKRVGIKLDDTDNLNGLRGKSRQVGKPGYEDLVRGLRGKAREEGKSLQQRMAHADARTRYYYETVNERFAKLIQKVGDNPTEAEVREVLRQIKKDLYKGGDEFLKPGATPRSSDLL